MERLLERGATVSLFSLFIAVAEEEGEEDEEKMEDEEFSFTESEGRTTRRGISLILEVVQSTYKYFKCLFKVQLLSLNLQSLSMTVTGS